jgi:glyoxylase-like metal-dependent hydrolase (beta-lactamase superfamily II)
MTVETLAQGVRRILAPNPGPWTLEGTNTYLLGDSRVVVLDPGPSIPEHLDTIRREAPQISAVLLSHRHADHAESAEDLASWLGVDLLEPDDGETITLDRGVLETIATPGHSSDHRCFLLRETRTLFSGDHVLGRGTTVVAHPDGDMSDYMRSLDRLMALDISVIYPGHGPVLDDPSATLEAYRRHRLAREAKVLSALSEDARDLERVLEVAYDDVDASVLPAARLSLRAHLDKLVADGAIHAEGDSWRLN